ncbi:MAG: ABC transporter permease [Candidatus Heimdallarchaeota archaeon]|nr:ABC transporter permease [Candidatus Heimdallarchaeota archaeon]
MSEDNNSEITEISGATTWKIILKRFRRNEAAILGFIILGFFIALAMASIIDELLFSIFGIPIFPYGPNDIFAGGASSFEIPSAQHWFGTDNVGRDIFVRIIYGAGISIRVGFLAVFVSLSVGTLIGLIAGYFGGIVDSILSMLIEMLLAFPAILLALAILAIFGNSLENAMLAVGIVYIPYYARIVRGQTLVERELVYVEAAKVLGAKTPRILLRHILPNVLGVLIIYSTLGIGTAILEVAALSFLGLGALPPTAEWGAMIGDGRKYFASAPHLVFFPGVAIVLAVLSFNLVGDGLREALDPRFKR